MVMSCSTAIRGIVKKNNRLFAKLGIDGFSLVMFGTTPKGIHFDKVSDSKEFCKKFNIPTLTVFNDNSIIQNNDTFGLF